MQIVINLGALLARRKMSVAELADRAGVTLANMSALNTGNAKTIRISTLDAICKALDCQPADILESRST
jgi:putative transcriptional regulator